MYRKEEAPEAAERGLQRRRIPDLSGMTVGTWRILYEAEGEEKPYCMCRCVRCGVRKIIAVFKIRKGYPLRCPECRIRRLI